MKVPSRSGTEEGLKREKSSEAGSVDGIEEGYETIDRVSLLLGGEMGNLKT